MKKETGKVTSPKPPLQQFKLIFDLYCQNFSICRAMQHKGTLIHYGRGKEMLINVTCNVSQLLKSAK